MPTQPSPPSVLIVDESSDSRAVLRDLLERDGAAVVEARSAQEAALQAERRPPLAVVIDTDGEAWRTAEELAAWADRTKTPIVAIGTKRPVVDYPSTRDFVRKPYHYRALIHKIHDAVASRRAA